MRLRMALTVTASAMIQTALLSAEPEIGFVLYMTTPVRQTWSGGIVVQSQTIGSGSDWNQGYGFQFWRCRHGLSVPPHC